jgi:NhaA family Na+:H+ antiporter
LADIADPVTVAVFTEFAPGKPVGVLSFTWVTIRLGVATRPDGLGWGVLLGGALLAGTIFLRG